MKTAITFYDVTKRFTRSRGKPVVALDRVTMMIGEGQVFGLLGPNGSGKTTAVNLLAGLLRPTAGEVRVHGVDPAKDVNAVRAMLGVVPQETALYSDLSAWENLLFHARLYQVPAEERFERISAALELVGLTERKGDRVATYSGGMQRRLALARALLSEPKVVVLDEPTLGVDVQTRATLWERVRQIAQEGNTVLLTTNYMEEAEALADHLVILDRGHLIAEGTPDTLKRRAGRTLIELEASLDSSKLERLESLKGVQDLVWDPPHLRITVIHGHEVVQRLLALSRAQDTQPDSLTMRPPNLNDAFLVLTGREFRD